jgi:hypothetical protein
MYIWVLLPIDHSPISSLIGSSSATRVLYLINNIIIIKFNWVIRIWSSVFTVFGPYSSYGFYSVLLYYYLADLFEILTCPKSFLLCPLVGTEKVGSSLLTPDWYKESIICYYIISLLRIFISLHQYGIWGHTLIHLFYIVRYITRFRWSEYVLLAVHSPRMLSPQEPKFSIYVGVDAA